MKADVPPHTWEFRARCRPGYAETSHNPKVSSGELAGEVPGKVFAVQLAVNEVPVKDAD